MNEFSRRAFLRLAAGSMPLLAVPVPGLAATLVSDPKLPEGPDPGRWALFSTTCRECPAGCGMQARVAAGRTRKAEGNPDHPLSRGGLCARGQSAVQGLYDPDRVRAPLRRQGGGAAAPASWRAALEELGPVLGRARRVIVVSDLQNGALAEVMAAFAAAFGGPQPVFFESFDQAPMRRAHETLYGEAVVPAFDFEDASFLISFGADFLEAWTSNVEHARQFAAMRDPDRGGAGRMGTFAYVGPRLSMTAANADEFLQVPPGGEILVARGMLRALVQEGLARRTDTLVLEAAKAFDPAWLGQTGVTWEAVLGLARRFAVDDAGPALGGPVGARGGAALALAESVALLNHAAGRLGRGVDFSRPHALSGAALPGELEAALGDLGPDDVVLVHQADPAYARPGTADLLAKAGTVVALGQMMDATASLAHWVLPVDSPLEAFGDFSPAPGVHCLQQPTMVRLHDTRPAGDVLLSLAEAAGRPLSAPGAAPAKDFLSWLQARWAGIGREAAPGTDPQIFWRDALIRGGVWQAPLQGAQPELQATLGDLAPLEPVAAEPSADGVALWAWASIRFFDGRTANRGWLQELPEPVSSIVWDSYLDVHPDTAAALGLAPGDLADVRAGGRSARVPVRVTTEVHPRAVALGLGLGHETLGETARGVGASAFALFGPDGGDGYFGTVAVAPSGDARPLVPMAATLHQHHREIILRQPLAEAAKAITSGDMSDAEPLFMPLPEDYRPERDMYEGHKHDGHRWAMVIDLNRCIGCGACSTACYAENNLAVVGRERAEEGRDMSWVKVVPYQHEEDPLVRAWIPLPCQHCDAAPCEPVCPVFAAVHSAEGLNAQIYNRCVGTRYCSNNCIYKVRRFNWFDPVWRAPLEVQLNPDVTVRCRGVMEKCTFCVQRIRAAEHLAKIEDREVRDGDIAPACVQSCPTGAFVFGDLMDPESRVSRIVAGNARRYQLLHERNTKPAVFYLKKVVPGAADDGHGMGGHS